MDFLDSNLKLLSSGWLCFVISLCIPYVCIVSLFVFTCISTCAFGILNTCLMMNPRLIKSLSIL